MTEYRKTPTETRTRRVKCLLITEGIICTKSSVNRIAGCVTKTRLGNLNMALLNSVMWYVS